MATKKVRALSSTPVYGRTYPPNTVLVLDAELAKQLVAAGIVDDAKEAVAYCETELGAVPVKPAEPAPDTPPADGAGG